jgi:hypothetical protein
LWKKAPKWCLRLLVAAVIFANVAGIIGPGTASADTWYNASWLYRKKITLNAASGGASLSNFPVLINLTSDTNLGTHAQLDADDILFTAADKTTKLNHEIEKYTSNGATANMTAWVNIPTLSSSTTTVVYMYYGNAGASSQQNKTAVWDSNFKMVQHLEESAGGANAITDSTTNANNGTDHNTPTFGVNGKIDGAITLNKAADQYIQLPASNSIISGSIFTMESWITTTTNHPAYGVGAMEGRIVNLHRGAGAGSAASLYVEQNKVALFYYDTGTSHYLTYTANYYDGVPHHLAATYTTADGIFRLYYDGTQVASAAVSGTFSGFGTYQAYIGTHDGLVRNFDGTVDEVRISNSSRTAGWIQTSYNNQNSPSTFYTVGSEETPVVAPTVTTSAASLVEETSASFDGNITATGGENATQRGFQWSTSPIFASSANWTESGSYGAGAFSYALPAATLTQGTLYYVRAFAKNSAGQSYGGNQSFLTKPEAPAVFTAATFNSTQIDLSWTKGTGANNTMVRGKLGSYPTSVSDGYQVYFNTGTTASDTGLTPSTTYYYRAWSEVTNGSQQWSDAYLQSSAATSAAGATVTTNAATSAEETTATLNGVLTFDGGEACQYSFEWGTVSGVYTDNITWTGSLTTGQTFNTNLTSLTQGQRYYYRAKVKNSAGVVNGSELDFLTKPETPAGFSAVNAGTTQINLSWIKGTGANRTMVRYSSIGFPATTGDGTLAYFNTGTAHNVTGLTPGVTYYFSAWSEVTNGSQQWSDAHVTASAATTAVLSPSVTTNTATGVDETVATISGTLTNNGSEDCTWTLQWGTATGTYTSNTTWSVGTITTGASFTHSLAGLSRGTKYYYRAGVHNSSGYVYGAEQEFLTKPAVPAAFSATVISDTQIDLSWTLGDGAGRTMVRYKTSGYPTSYTDGTQVYFNTGTSVSATGLMPGTTYYFSAWSEKTGSQQWSNTSAASSVTTTGSPPIPVGGKIFPSNKTLLVTPWLALTMAAIAAICWITIRMQKKQR